ncbi:glycosyltransferase family 4 protein [Microbacterium paludicola]|uniref:glycosyltransferase family 4 protein n=1 Tax=Microbacterium paludicola TaxID=300019 RepID=UPI0011A525B4|nr:glycosyltransferase family 4 protein [Microbacterium paludicola]
MTLNIFVPGVGQHENIGDVILRRQLLSRLREHGTLHIYVGSSTDEYDEALGVKSEDVLYRSFAKWYRRAIVATATGKGTYVFKPGEIQLTLVGMKEHLSMLPVAALARLRGNPVVRVGTGSRNFARVPGILMRPSIFLSNLTMWRDTRTSSYLPGGLMPDLAFAEGSTPEEMPDANDRDIVIVSMRSDREQTPQPWVDSVRAFAANRGLRIVVVSQVIRDNPKTEELAKRLGGEPLTWSGADHGRREDELRSLYRRSLVAVSDRLHVLIAAFTEGAMPAGLLTDSSDKISRHFEAADIQGVTLEVSPGVTEEAIVAWLQVTAERREDLLPKLASARREIDEVFDRIGSLYAERSRLVAYHVGRRGEVAGGMTQVMNSYLSWSFRDFDIRFVRSRGAGKTLKGALVLIGAMLKVCAIRRANRAVLVVHLSQGGSFVREGLLLKIGRLRGICTIAQLHGSSFAQFAQSKPKLVGSVLRRADGIHALSNESADAAARLAPDAAVVVIPNAVEEGSEVRKRPIVVFAGAVSHRKGVDVLVQAWDAAFAEAGWKLVLAGPVLEDAVLPDEIPKGIEVVGALQHQELMRTLEESSVAVLPSRDEAMPMFLIEAMARRNAIISTTVGGIPDLVSPESGVLVDPGDSVALRRALAEVLSDEREVARLQDGAIQAFRERFDATVIAPKLNEFWLSCYTRTHPQASTER